MLRLVRHLLAPARFELVIDGHAVVVTGASRGLGAAIASSLVAEGANVVAAARSTDALESLHQAWRQARAEQHGKR